MRHPYSDVRQFLSDPLNFILDRGVVAQGPLEQLRLGLAPVHLLIDPAHAREVLTAPESRFAKGRHVARLRAVVGESVLTATGDLARQRRHLAHQGLRADILAERCEALQAVATAAACRMAAQQGPVAIAQPMAALALRMIAVVLFGEEALDEEDEERLIAAVSLIEADVAAGFWRAFTPPWTAAREKARLRHALAELDAVVTKVRQRSQPGGIVSTLAEAGLSDQEIRDELLTLLLTGHETTGSVAAWLLYELARRPLVCQAIAAEVTAASAADGTVPYEAWRRMEVTTRAVNETLRLYPGAWWFSREAMKDTELAGVRLRKGATVLVVPYLFHRDPRWWGDGRDLSTWFADRPPPAVKHAFLPFGFGPRACVGMAVSFLELQIIAATFAASFSMEVAGPDNPSPIASVTLQPDPGLALRLLPFDRLSAVV